MIIRKPYAFLIKNFRKIHIALFLLSLYIANKLVDVNGFVNEFMRLGIYDSYSNPITRHITSTLMFVIFMVVIGCGALIFLLRYKKKPWKLYLIPFIEYLALFFVLSIIKNFFLKATYDIATTDLRFSRDLLLIFLIAQLPAVAIFIMRVLGMDTQKFHFNLDEEYLEFSEDDREEIEINIDIDTNSFKRFFKRLWRNIQYLYNEHKMIFIIAFGIICLVFVFNVYKTIFVVNKVYRQGQNYSFNGYTMKVNKVYFTDKSYSGEKISNISNFVIVELEVTNYAAPRRINVNNFHLKSGIDDYGTQEKVFCEEFHDLGKCYDNAKELKRGETLKFIVVYKVNKRHSKNSFVLFYQEDKVLRKIKLNVTDISKIKEGKKLKLGEDLKFTLNNTDYTVSFDDYSLSDKIEYTIRLCDSTNCYIEKKRYTSPQGNKVLKIAFASNEFDGKDMIDFSIKYGKIIYKNSEGEDEVIDFNYPFNRTATGKYIYTLVPDEVADSKSIEVNYIVRNVSYIYKLK